MESISRISTLLENARELTLDAAQAARSARGSASTRSLPTAQLKKLLDSRNEREVLEGLRRVISMMYRQQKTLPFFSSIVKNVASPSLEIKKLVYIYLIHHAEQEPDMALLSINTIQKSLSDTNPHVRALALRTMSGIRVPVISQIVSLAIKKGVADMSPHVRKAAALAIPKCYRLEPQTLPQLLDCLATLIADRQYFVAGAAVSAFNDICPDRLDLIHKHYRGLVSKIVDMDEWSQLATMRMMTFYARKCFPRRTKPATSKGTSPPTTDLQDFYGDNSTPSSMAAEQVVVLDPDLVLYLNAIKPLLQSRNSGVVIAVARCYSEIGTPDYVKAAVGPLVALLRGAQDIQQVALYNIVSVCLAQPESFARYASHFLVRSTDSAPVWELKLEVLTLIFPHSPLHTKSLILNELEHFSSGTDKALVREAVRAIGRCAQADPSTAPRCLRLLLSQITSLDGTLAAESLTVIRHLIQQAPDDHVGTVVRLAKNLDSATDPHARATIVWLVGEFSGLNGADNIAADVLRILLRAFSDEAEVAKQQIVLLAAKVYLHHINRENEEREQKTQEQQTDKGADETGNDFDAPAVSPSPGNHPIARLWDYVLQLVRYDTSYDLRDRARLYRSLLGVPQLATLMLLAPKPAPHAPSPSETRRGYLLGSSALVLGGGSGGAKAGPHGLRGYESLPDWVAEGSEPDPSLRNNAEDRSPAVSALTAKMGYGDERRDSNMSMQSKSVAAVDNHAGTGAKTLDDWLAEDDGTAAAQLARPKANVSSQPAGDVEEDESSSEEEDEDDESEEDDDDEEDEDEDEDEEDESEDESADELEGFLQS